MAKARLLSTNMVAERSGLSAAYIRRLCREGKIPSCKVGTDWLINERELRRIRKQRESEINDGERGDQ